MRRSGTEYERMEIQAIEILEDYEIRKFPVDIKRLAKKMGINLIPYSSFGDVDTINFLINLFPDGFCKTNKQLSIYYNDKKDDIRINSTIGHEIKHIVNLDKNDTEDDLADYFSKVLRCPVPLLIYCGYTTRDELITNFGISYEQSGYLLAKITNRMKYHGKKCSNREIEFLRFVFGENFDETKIDSF